MRKTAKTNDKVRLDICAESNVRIFDPNIRMYSKQTLKQCYSLNENEKKRHCSTRVMEVDQGSFTSLVFTVAGGMEGKGRAFATGNITVVEKWDGKI